MHLSMQPLVKEHLDCEDQNDFEKSTYVFNDHWIFPFRDTSSHDRLPVQKDQSTKQFIQFDSISTNLAD